MASPRGDLVDAASSAITVIAAAVVLLRLGTRVIVNRKSGLDDLWITLAMVFSAALTVAVPVQTRNGVGMHISGVNPDMVCRLSRAAWVGLIVYGLSLTFTKISILVLYLRVFPSRRFRIGCFCLLTFIICYGIWVLLGSIFMCYPASYLWNRPQSHGHCQLERFWIYCLNASVNIAQEFAILLLPMPLLRRLRLLRGQKIALICVFALGGFVSIISIVWICHLATLRRSQDLTFDSALPSLYSTIEANVAIVCACLPVLRPLFARIVPDFVLFFPKAELDSAY
ncbi:hypothetical protein B0J11DRAFT_543192 [Dendryphion nanum]|uniref:Rhodopsin domain-containing protein n=1 Tax=Dendryphion nanum TaxID=256645 RepID=A0A9P9D1T1_9PLEO|nr:hypothetical protein B0J11DRAFT_543192 [Dendryphion nanum]